MGPYGMNSGGPAQGPTPLPGQGNEMLALMQALAAQQGMNNQANIALDPQGALVQRLNQATTTEKQGRLPQLFERMVDRHNLKKLQPELQSTLQSALESQQGMDQLKARIEQIKAAEAQAEQRRYEEAQSTAQYRREQQGRIDLANMNNDARMERVEKRGPGTVVKVGSTPKLDKGYQWVDPSDPSKGMEPIPGSGAAADAERIAQGEAGKAFNAQAVVETIDRAIGQVDNFSAGWGGKLKNVPKTDAKTLQADLSTIRGNLAFDRLKEMRDASKTGGALGQVSNIELGLLESTVASLDQEMEPQDLIERLNLAKKHYARFTDALNEDVPDGYDVKEIEGQRYIQVDGEWYPL